MILYMCRYAPFEILEAMGEKTLYLESEGGDLSNADTCMHPTVCSYTKAAFEEILSRDDALGVLFTSCCDSTRRHYDVLKRMYPDKFIHIIELPVYTNDKAAGLYKNALLGLIHSYEKFSGREFRAEALLELMEERSGLLRYARNDERGELDISHCGTEPVTVGLAGAKFSPSLKNYISEAGLQIVFDLTCSGQKDRVFSLSGKDSREFSLPGKSARGQDNITDKEIIDIYVNGIFAKFPCMRMVAGDERRIGIKDMTDMESADGIIYHTIKFCDNYAYEYASLLAGSIKPDVPILRIETDYTKQGAGQILTRVQAFAEQLRDKKGGGKVDRGTDSSGKGCTLGIDCGSTSTNAVIVDSDLKIAASATLPTGTLPAESAAAAAALACKNAGLPLKDILYTISTGYGRSAVGFADESITEITCHARGAKALFPEAGAAIDIGGQDSKVISVSETGSVDGFAMNDKCAAGTGRFLEKTSASLGVKLEDVGKAANAASETLQISNMCTVFAESEVVSLIAEGKDVNSILKGLCFAIASRNKALFARANARPPYIMTGGVARNEGVVKALEELLGEKIFVPDEPEIAGALGAAIIARQRVHG